MPSPPDGVKPVEGPRSLVRSNRQKGTYQTMSILLTLGTSWHGKSERTELAREKRPTEPARRLRPLGPCSRRTPQRRRAAVACGSRSHLGGDLVRGNAQLDSNRGKHSRSSRSQDALGRGTCGGRQGATGVPRGPRLRRGRTVGLSASSSCWPLV